MAFTAMIKVILTILTLANLALAASKRGLGADDGIPLSGFTGIGSKISWQYNWATTTTPKLDGLEYIPMLWSNKAELTSIWDTNAKYWLAHGSTTLLGFNEPDGCVNGLGSSCMSVAVAVPAFELWITPYAGTATIGAPAITNSNLAGQGVDWLNSFLSLANGAAGLDFLVMHWYGDAADLAGFKSQVTSLCNIVTKNNIPGGLWITEFKANGDAASTITFMKSALAWLDANTCVARYAWFGLASSDANLLISPTSPELSELGKVYRNN